MNDDTFIEPETFDELFAAAKVAYRRVAELVAQRITRSDTGALAAAAGDGSQLISEQEWEALTQDVSDAYGDAFLDALVAGGSEFGYLPDDSKVIGALAEQANGINDLASLMRDMLEVFIGGMGEAGVDEGDYVDQLTDSPQSPLNQRKAEAFARTAATAALNSGFSESFIVNKVPAISWITRRDERVRDAHEEVDRDIVLNGTPFTVGGFEARYPGDPNLPIGLRINCRCRLGYVTGPEVKTAVDSTKRKLYETARNLQIPGRSKMNKPELQLAVIQELCLQGLASGTDCPDVLEEKNMATLLVHARLGKIRGRYRMRRAELLAALAARFLEDPTFMLGFAATGTTVLAAEPMTVTRLDGLADEVVNGSPVSVEEGHAADLIEILGRHVEPVDLTLVRANNILFTAVARNRIARSDMPQIPEDMIDEFEAFIVERGVTVTRRDVNPLDVFATQSELDGRKVGKMVTAIRNEQFFPEHPAFVSSDGRILDGHHRWAALAALALSEPDRVMVAAQTSVGIDRLLADARQFAELHSLESKSHGMAWDPNQPRIPAGSAGGGRWKGQDAYHPDGRPRRRFHPTERGTVWEQDKIKAIAEERQRISDYEAARRPVEPPTREQRDRHQELMGKGVEALFKEGTIGVRPVPFPAASRLKGEPVYDKEAVAEVLNKPTMLSAFDPRTLHATQPGVTKAGVEYYSKEGGRSFYEYQSHGVTFADQDQKGNQYPVIYRNPRSGQLVILSGHHRAVAALLDGRDLDGIYVDPRNTITALNRWREERKNR